MDESNTRLAESASRPAQPSADDLFVLVREHHSPVPRPIEGGDLVAWLLSAQTRELDGVVLFDELCWRLLGQGIPLWRSNLSIGMLHPQMMGLGFRWWRDRALTQEFRIKHGMTQRSDYLDSPMRPSIEQGVTVRYRLDDEAALARYPLLREFREAGATEYLACPLLASIGRHRVITFTTDRPGGFTDAHIAGIDAILPAMGLVVESKSLQGMNAGLLDLYLGRTIGRHILGGDIFRGQGKRLRAALMAVDLRGFTTLADRMGGEELIQLLDDYFDAVAASVHTNGGEILKFVGDGVLAIFESDGHSDARAAAAALAAGEELLHRIDTTNENRHAVGQELIRIGVGLHVGEVIYGNVGAIDRLDFTAIGPAVNLVCRLEALTKRLERPLLVSESFAEVAPHPLVSLGFHPVRGLSEPQEVFGLPASA
jgi:adenylate cyclase